MLHILLVEVGMGRVSMRAGPTRHEPARGSARCLLRGPRACHCQEILFQARTGTSPPRLPMGRLAGRTLLSFVFLA